MAPVITGVRPPGVYRWRSRAHPAAVRRELRDFGWGGYVLDGHRVTSPTDLLDRCAEALRMPHWSRRSIEALTVCLDDLSWLPGRGHVLLWPAWRVLASRDPAGWWLVHQAFAGAIARRPATSPPLYVLLRGPAPDGGPDLDIPVL